MTRVVAIISAIGLAVVMGAWLINLWAGSEPEKNQTPVFGKVPAFELTDQSGNRITRADLEGTVWVAAFLFTRCQGQCPLLIQQLKKLQSWERTREDVRLVSFSVDPDHDTPEILQEYATSIGADTSRWSFVTGDKEVIYELAREGFLLGVEPAPDPDGKDRLEPVLHSPRMALVDSQARVRGYYLGLDDAEMERMARDLKQLLSEPGI